MDMSKLCIIAILAFLLPLTSVSGRDIPISLSGPDDSEVISSRLKESMDSYGLISVEQHSGRLLFSPLIEKVNSMPVKQKFLVPAMIVNQTRGLKIISELPFSCFIMTGTELNTDHYKGFKQFETARYIRDVKGQTLSRVLICQAVGLVGARTWSKDLALAMDDDKSFVFEEHTSVTGEHFYYFLNADGLFEMYL